MKKVFVLSAILLALGAVSYFYFKADQKEAASKDLYMAIPNQFPLALESQNWKEVFEKVDTFTYFETLKKQDWIIGSKLNLEELNALSLFFQNKQLPSLNSHTLIAYGNAGNSQLGIYTATRINGILELKNVLAAFDQAGIEYSTNQFEEYEIVSIENDPDGLLHIASFTISNQLFLYSHQANFVEEGLISLSKETHPWTALAQELEGKEDLRCYVKPSQLNYLASYLLHPEAASLMNSLENISSHSVFQLDVFGESMSISGFVDSGEGTLTDTLKNYQTASLSCIDYLPSNTAIYKGIGIANNFEQFNDDYNLKRMHSLIDEALVLFTLESYSEDLSNRKGALIPLRAIEPLPVLLELDSTITLHKEEGEVQIYVSDLGELLNKTFYTPGYFDEEVYFLVMNNQLMLSSNYSVCEQFVFAQREGKILRTNEDYMSFRAASASKTNLDFYINLGLLQAYLTEVSTSNSWQTLFEQFSMQYANIGNDIYANGKLSFKSGTQQESKLLWATSLDTTAAIPASVVTNHNTGKKELIIQDNLHQLYLITASGEINWKVPLKGQIQSEIFQIDYYKNNKLQYVFNTTEYIYIIDRNGERVDGFPISLPSKATNGMLLINYDKSNKYRYMVACDNGNLYGYEKNGSPLTGWSPKKDVGTITHPVQHVLYQGKDYIFFNNDQGLLYALNRKGENRIKPAQTNNQHNAFQFIDGSFVGGDYGSAIAVDLNGGVNERVLLDSTFNQCLPANSLLQANLAYAFSSGTSFKFQHSQWQNYAGFMTDEEILEIESLKYKSKLWFILKTTSQSYLIDEIGNLHPAFPLKSTQVSFVDLIPGKQRLMIYADDQGNLRALEIAWSNL